jgi:hypothetical protein
MTKEHIKEQPKMQTETEDLKVLTEGEVSEVVQACCSSGASAKIR